MPNEHQKVAYDPVLKSLDVTLADHMEIMIRDDGKVIWINEGGRCLLRVCGIEGEIILNDQRKKKKNHLDGLRKFNSNHPALPENKKE